MAKSTALEEHLAESIRQVGGFGSLKEGGAPRRDSPFGPGYVRGSAGKDPDSIRITPPPSEATPSARVTPATTSSTMPLPPSRKDRVEAPLNEGGGDEAGYERVTVLMAADTRDAVNLLARRLQRRRTRKACRITANTVFRAAIRLLVEAMPLRETDIANTEDELLALLRTRTGRGP